MISSHPPAEGPIGLIGFGLIGSALAERLLAAGPPVLGWDIDPARVEELRRTGATAATGIAAVFDGCRRVLLSLPSHREVADVIAAAGDTLTSGLTIIDTTTGDPASAEQLAASLDKRGITYLDATISGSSAQLRAGKIALMVGGNAEAFAACGDIFDAIGRQTFYAGPSGAGAKLKLVTNLVLGLNRAAMAEGLAFAQALGIDLELALRVMRGSAAYSKIMDSKGERMIHGDFAPDARLSQHLKDVRLIVETGQQAGLLMPLSVAHRAVLEKAEESGLGDLDNSAIIKVLMEGRGAHQL